MHDHRRAHTPRPRLTDWRKSRLAMLAAAAALAAMVALLTLASIHSFVPDSDGATVVLEGQVMKTGHLMLHGWSLSLDSFWTVDAVVYMLVEFFTGMRSLLLYLVPAIIATLVVMVGAWLARSGRPGMGGVVAGATVVVLLGLPGRVLSSFFLSGPLHVGTALWCLIAFAGLRSGRFGRGWVVGVVFLAAGALGDFQIAALGVASVFAAGLVAMLRRRDWHAGLPEVTAAVGSLILAGLIRQVADAVGTFSINTSHPTASTSQMFSNVLHIATWGANMLGIGHGSIGNGGIPPLLQVVFVAGLVAVVGGVVAAVAHMVQGIVRGDSLEKDATSEWILDDLLVFAFLFDLVVFVFLTSSNDQAFMRYLTAAVIFGSILAGRFAGQLAGAVHAGRLALARTNRRRRTIAALCLIVVAGYGSAFGLSLTTPIPKKSYSGLGQFLEAHQLLHGIGDYWSASITTVATDGAVTVRPVITNPNGIVVRYQRQSTVSWYAGQSFEFLVYDTARPWGGVERRTASLTFGPIAHTYIVGTYRVLVWGRSISVGEKGFAPVPVTHAKRG